MNGERTENERRTNGEQNEKKPSELWVELRYGLIVNDFQELIKVYFGVFLLLQVYIFMTQVKSRLASQVKCAPHRASP